MRLNQLKAEEVLTAVEAFENSINDEAVCAAASSLHGGDPCKIFGKDKGGFNLCYFVAFDARSNSPATAGTDGVDRWVVRIPIVPWLGCPDEKHRSEIATMKYLLEQSNIPIPKLYGYSLSNRNPLGTPFMLIEYIDASPLLLEDIRNKQWKGHIMRQLAGLHDQFRQRLHMRMCPQNVHTIPDQETLSAPVPSLPVVTI